MKRLALIAFALLTAPANASPWHCYGPYMTHQRVCHVCQRGQRKGDGQNRSGNQVIWGVLHREKEFSNFKSTSKANEGRAL